MRRTGWLRVALVLVLGWLCLSLRSPAADPGLAPRRYSSAWERQAERDASALVERGTLRRRAGTPVAVNLERRITQSLERTIRTQSESAARVRQQRERQQQDRQQKIQDRQQQIRERLQENLKRRQDQRRTIQQQNPQKQKESTRVRAVESVALRRMTADPVSAVSQRRISAVGTQSGTDGTGNTTTTVDTPLLNAIMSDIRVIQMAPAPVTKDAPAVRDTTRTTKPASVTPVISDTPVRTVDRPSISITPRPAPTPVPPPTDVVDTPPRTPTKDTPPKSARSR